MSSACTDAGWFAGTRGARPRGGRPRVLMLRTSIGIDLLSGSSSRQRVFACGLLATCGWWRQRTAATSHKRRFFGRECYDRSRHCYIEARRALWIQPPSSKKRLASPRGMILGDHHAWCVGDRHKALVGECLRALMRQVELVPARIEHDIAREAGQSTRLAHFSVATAVRLCAGFSDALRHPRAGQTSTSCKILFSFLGQPHTKA